MNLQFFRYDHYQLHPNSPGKDCRGCGQIILQITVNSTNYDKNLMLMNLKNKKIKL